MSGSNCKVAPFIKGAAPTCNCKLEHPFIKGAVPTVKVHVAPFIYGATCSIYEESSSNFKFQCKISNYNNVINLGFWSYGLVIFINKRDKK